jgi:hypothetical protein
MKIELDPADLQPVIEQTITAVLERLEADRALLGGKLACREAEAARLMGIPPHSLRDARLRGEIRGCRVGSRVLYERSELLAFLARQREEGSR